MMIPVLVVLCEGQTEDRFVHDVLAPFLRARGIVVKSRILVTSKNKNLRGGLLHYAQVKRDLNNLFGEFSDNATEKHWFTTMFDYYALPDDFPGFGKKIANPYQRVQHLEDAFTQDMGHYRLLPYIQVHEFEALVLSDPEYLLDEYPNSKKAVQALKKSVEEKKGNPELVNDNVTTAPSKRIIKALSACNYSYNKKKVGPEVAGKIGMEKLMEECKHFGKWVERLCEVAS